MNKEKYEVKITKYVDNKPCQMLLGDVNSLNELIENIESFVDRMKPIEIEEEIAKTSEKTLKKEEKK